jgi:valyl-tRNA synthetase
MEPEEIENRYRKIIKELGLSTLDAFIVLASCFEVLMPLLTEEFYTNLSDSRKIAINIGVYFNSVLDDEISEEQKKRNELIKEHIIKRLRRRT